ncbi:Uncharacterised protein [Mycobacteroides abscessus subsp. abscessus]|nr:Uncharacterised protein [Mycobacteroides abscessus subsp. abscessus]
MPDNGTGRGHTVQSSLSGSNLTRRAVIRGAVGVAAVAAFPTVAGRIAAQVGEATPGKAAADVSIRYISAVGSDDNDGLTPSAPWATIKNVNSALTEGRCALLFRRGDTFYGELVLPFGTEVGAYGSGDMPVLTLYKLLNRPGGWVEYTPGIWKIDLAAPSTHDGHTATSDANVGFLLVDGVVHPNLKFDLSGLSAPWDFTTDVANHVLYVKAQANPTTLANDIRAAPNGDAGGVGGAVIRCDFGSNDIHDVRITGSGGCGIMGSGPDVRIRGCFIDHIGGSRLLLVDTSGATRYGNGIANWINVDRWWIEGNEISDVYDAAWSPQGFDPGGAPVFWRDLTFRNNYAHDCCQMVEFWSMSDNPASPGFTRILVEGNRFQRAGLGVFAAVRPNQDVRVHVLTYLLETPVDITIQNNTFDGSYGAFSYHLVEPPAGYLTRNNTIRLAAGHKLEFQRPETIEQAPLWQAATGREKGSVFGMG